MWRKLNILKKTDSNSKIIARNVFGAFIIKGFSLIISLFMMPCYMSFFSDNVVLGVWFAILSVLSWTLSFDLGIGNGLRNKLVEALIEKDNIQVRRYVSSAYYIQAAVVLLVSLLGYFFIALFNWNIFFNVPETMVPPDIMLKTVRWTFIGIMFQFFLRLIISIIYALQLAFITGLVTAASNLLQIVFLIFYPSHSLTDNLLAMTISNIFTANFPLIICTIYVFSRYLKEAKPNIKYFELQYSKSIMSIGGLFFFCQITYMFFTCTNEYFISKYWGTEYVVDYRIYNSVFGLIGMLFSLSLTPVWSVVTKAKVEENYAWLRSLYSKLKKAILVGVFLEFFLLPFLQIIINIWLRHRAIEVNYFYAINFAIYQSVSIYLAVCSTMVAGFGTIKLTAICYTLAVILKYFLITSFSNGFNSWIYVIALNSVLLLPYCIIQQYILDKYLYRKIGGDINVQK